ncbi:MAG: hypothetical protein KA792_07245 [Bacteroidales bacterium]|nr:hypothetical protein [Bacteroidales bacterium]
MKNYTTRYLQFPLFLMQNLFIEKEKTINDIITSGLYRCSTKMNADEQGVARQLIYDYYRKANKLPSYVFNKIKKYIKEGILYYNEDNNGFNFYGNFYAKKEIEDLMNIFETDIEFKERATEYFKMREAYRFLKMTGNAESAIKRAKEIEKLIPENEPMPMVNVYLLFEFRDKNKSEYEIAQFAAYIGIKSIMGKRKTVKTNKEMIISRMFGFPSYNKININNSDKELKDILEKYSKRYHIDKILEELQLNWKVNIDSKNIRGMNISIDNKMSLEEMIMHSEKNKRKNKINNLKQKKNEAREKVLAELYDKKEKGRLTAITM